MGEVLGERTHKALPPLAEDAEGYLNHGIENALHPAAFAADRAERKIEMALFCIAVAIHQQELIVLPNASTGCLPLLL